MNPLVPLIWTAGVVHLLIASANFFVPGKLGYRENLARVSPIIRQVFVLHSIFIVMTVLGFAGLCLFFAPELAAASALGRALTGFMGAFWVIRLLLQVFYVDPEVKKANRAGDVAYTLAISCLGVVFVVAALGIVR